MKPHYNLKPLKPFRKHLRNTATSAENYLWNFLKQSKLDGRKFRRQHSIEHFIVDFFCYTEMLVIELDGEYHKYSFEEDKARDEF